MRASSTALPLPPNLGMEHSNRSLPELRVVSDGLRAPDAALLPMSAVDPEQRGRDHSRHLSVGGLSPNRLSAVHQGRSLSTQRYSPDSRPQSYIDMLQHIPYQQQLAPTNTMMSNSFLRSAVGSNASLLDNRKTLEMYRANVKNINEPAIQYEFAIFMVQTAMECTEPNDRADMLRESKAILQKLADRSYPFAQYYLGDGYASGLFNKGKEDHDRAFPLFVAASKHGHAEAGYRAALCYEFGWGCRRDYAKAVQFFRASASKNHPGAATRLGLACLQQTMGMIGKYKQGVSYLKRAAESADAQYNAGPYELARLHETGFGDDIFKDKTYAAQLYTRSAELGHADANLVLGKAYEHGLLNCPKDAGLSIHFYTGAAQSGIPEAMMALCAWYLFGAEPVLEKNENEAFEWAKQAADLGTFEDMTTTPKALPLLTCYQDLPRLNTPSATSKKSALAAGKIPSMQMPGMFGPLSRVKSGPKRDWPSFAMRLREVVQIPRKRRMMARQKRRGCSRDLPRSDPDIR